MVVGSDTPHHTNVLFNDHRIQNLETDHSIGGQCVTINRLHLLIGVNRVTINKSDTPSVVT